MVRKGRHIVDRVFVEGLRDVEMPVPNRIWNGLAAQMENDRLRRKMILWRFTTAASVLLLVGLGSWMMLQLNGFNSSNNAMAVAHQVVKISPLAERCFEERPTTNFAQSTPPIGNDDAKQPQMLAENVKEAIFIDGNAPALTDKSESAIAAALANAVEDLKAIRLAAQQPLRLPFLTSTELSPRPVALPKGELPERTSMPYLPKHEGRNAKVKEFTFDAIADESDKEKHNKHWQVGGAFSPDYTFESTTPIQTSKYSSSSRTLPVDATQASIKRVSPIASYSAGTRVGYTISDRVSLRSGVMYTNRQTSASGQIDGYGKTESYQSNLSLHFLEVPVSVRYNVIHNKHLDYFVSTGMSGNLFLAYDNYLSTANGKVAERTTSEGKNILTPSQANAIVSTGLQYRMGKFMSLNLEPGLRYGFARNDFAFSRSRSVSMNLVSSLNYHF